MVNHKNPFVWQLSFTHKLGALAAFFLVLFGGLSAYSLFESYEIRREIEETSHSDIPLFKTAVAIKQQNQEFINTIELIQNYRTVNSELHLEKQIALIDRLHALCEQINSLAEKGSLQADYALQDELKKEGYFRLNQSVEDYQRISELFQQFSSSHHLLGTSLSKLSPQHLEIKSVAAFEENEEFQLLEKEMLEANETIEKIFTFLDLHMESSLAIAQAEHKKLQFFNLILALTALTSGTICAVSLMSQLKNSLVPVTKKAQRIARALGENSSENFSNGLSPDEIAMTVTAGKEIAELGLAFNQMVKNLAQSRQAQLNSDRLLAKEKSLIAFTLSSIGDGVITTNQEGIIMTANVAAERLLNLPVTQLVSQNLVDIFLNKTLDDRNIFTDVLSENCQRITIENGQEKAKILDISHSPICSKEKDILGSVIVLRDMTQMVDTTRKLTWQASHDLLTGLANRRKFLARLESLHQANFSVQTEHAILYLDLDRFKIVNDTCGHDAGDELLSQISQHISNEVRQSDLVARLGGDEFGIILNNCSLEKAIAVAEKILIAVEKFRFSWLDKQFSLGVSIGAVVYSPSHDDPIMILKAADKACYNAKNKGRNQVYAVPDTKRHLADQNAEMNWLAVINQALAEDHFQLFQQKITGVNEAAGSHHHEHYEILLRLKTADGSILSPGAFLPIAERYQLMSKVDRWVISHFFASHGDYLRSLWRKQTSYDLESSFYSLNLSSESLGDPQLIPFLEKQFTQYQIPPELICFEITETVAIANLHRATQIIRAIKNLGCRFALDDFGSGMSSFGYLQTLPVDFLKIDGLFIRELCQNSMNEIIVTALHQVARAVKIKTIAEFVEDEATLQKLRDIGIDYAQGYGIGKPVPLRPMKLVNNHCLLENATATDAVSKKLVQTS
ncbi:MAG: EAL domain-containing protein [Limnothrix sp.]